MKASINKLKVFISYSSLDNDKIDLIQKAMKHPRYSNLYEAIIVARSDEDDTEFLNKTVEENMKVAHIVIPVITKKSYKEQWMNQEIVMLFRRKNFHQ